jgi:hypothetical protein
MRNHERPIPYNVLQRQITSQSAVKRIIDMYRLGRITLAMLICGSGCTEHSRDRVSQDELWAKELEAENRFLAPHRALIQTIEAFGGAVKMSPISSDNATPALMIQH